jgi:hypothetical protein
LNGILYNPGNVFATIFNGGALWRSWLIHCATIRKVAGSISNLEYFIDIILPAALWPCGRPSLSQK